MQNEKMKMLFLSTQNRILVTCSVLLLLIGYADIILGYKISFSIFYLAPIGLITWYSSRSQGVIFSGLAAVIWYIADYLARLAAPDILILTWNSLMRFGFFILVTWLLDRLKQLLALEEKLARKDHLTGLWNRLAFYEMAETEIFRAGRYGHHLSLAYIDLDNFKKVNDTMGHEEGDRLLKLTAETVSAEIRKTDIFSRIGGDEFALLLPETEGLTATALLVRIRDILTVQMKENSWLVTFSIGIISFSSAPSSVSLMLRLADELMYSVKQTSKNNIVHKDYTGDANGSVKQYFPGR